MNIYKKTLSYRLVLLMLLITSGPIFCISTWSYWSGSRALEAQYLKSFQWVALSKGQSVKRYLVSEMIRADAFSADEMIKQLLLKYTVGELTKVEASKQLTDVLYKKIKIVTNRDGIYESLILDSKGQILASDRPELAHSYQFPEDFITRALKTNTISNVYKHPATGEIGFLAGSPIPVEPGKPGIGIVVNRISMKQLDIIVSRGVEQFGDTGDFYLVNKDGIKITKSRFNQKDALQEEVNTQPVHLFREKHQAYSGSYPNYRGIEVLGASEWKIIAEAENVGWLFIAEMDNSEAHTLATNLSWEIAIFGVATVLVSLGLGVLFGRWISAPIKTAVQEFLTTSTELSTTANQHERTAVHQAAAVNETSATIDELGRSSHQSILQADSANSTAQQAVANAMQGAQAMDDMLASMVELSSRVDNIGTQILRLSEQTSQIGHVTEAVKDIANQTNLLALNAAVEATRAGEHGKGFTVVSQEIRKLAEQSKKSAEKISDLVNQIQKGTNATVLATEAGTQTTKMSQEQVKHAKQSFDILSNSVNNIAEVLQQLSLTAKQQANATNQIVDAIAMINTGANETAKGISQSKIAIQNLNNAAEKLQAMV